jgi:hypothetical protein
MSATKKAFLHYLVKNIIHFQNSNVTPLLKMIGWFVYGA